MPDNSIRPTSRVAPWNNPKLRALFFQIVVLLAVVAFGAFIVHNTLLNLDKRGIKTGFEFLHNEAGFGILQTLIPYSESSPFIMTFWVGLLNTLLVSFLGIVFATLLGFLMGIARLSKNWLVAKLATVYIETFRNIPLLLQIFFWYFAVLQALPAPRQSISLGEAIFLNVRGLYLPKPVLESGFIGVWIALGLGLTASIIIARWARRRQQVTGQIFPVYRTGLALTLGLPFVVYWLIGAPMGWDIPHLQGFNFKGGITIIPELAALVTALTIYTGAFIAEVVRAGILAVPHGQTEAAHALGLNHGQTLRQVVIPQAMRVIIPPLTSQYLNLTKNSSLATAIGYPDLVAVFAGTTLNQTGQAVEVITMTMAVYLVISLSISFLMNLYNRRMALVER